MTHIALITTTVNVPTVLVSHLQHVPPGSTLDVVVAGDVQTPDAARVLVEDLGGTYLDVHDERVDRWTSAKFVGTRSIQRRNLALLHALTLGPDIIITIDDDNVPVTPTVYLSSFIEGFTNPVTELFASSVGWYNPGDLLEPPVTHRGYPLGMRHVPWRLTIGDRREYQDDFKVGVVAGLWLGDPDVDAIERIVNDPYVHDVGAALRDRPTGVVLAPRTWAPFNTQNTAFAWDVAPLMQCLVGVGRYDDIWMSYVARRILDDLGWSVRYGYPLAHQSRNAHDLIKDMRAEYHGYLNTEHIVSALRELGVRSDVTPLEALALVYRGIKHVFTSATRNANDAWVFDASEAVKIGESVRSQRSDNDGN